MKKKLFQSAFLAVALAFGSACDNSEIDDAVDEVEDAAEEAGDQVEDAAEEAGDKVQDATE